MSLEKTLERIADALEAIAAKATAPTGAPVADPKQTAARTEKAAAQAKPTKPAEEPKKVAGPTEEQVGAVIGKLLEANLKDSAVELLGKFGAKSKSTLKSDDYAAFIAGAEELLSVNE